MIISIASGKGGTGKTTVAVNLARSIPDPVQLLDCDVEEPNAHLFLDLNWTDKEAVSTPVPQVDLSQCTYCGKCAEICRFKAIAVIPDTTVLTFPELCHSCGGCVAVCPERAITEVGRELGVLERGSRGRLSFLHGRLRVGEAMAPPLIREVRRRREARKVTVIDAPPGTSCPVIAAMKGVDFVLLVTEPTPFGLHDLKLAVGAVEILGIPAGLVINRSDVGDDGVKRYAAGKKLPVLMEIPFQREIAAAYSRGETMVDALPEWRERFAELYSRIDKIAKRSGAAA